MCPSRICGWADITKRDASGWWGITGKGTQKKMVLECVSGAWVYISLYFSFAVSNFLFLGYFLTFYLLIYSLIRIATDTVTLARLTNQFRASALIAKVDLACYKYENISTSGYITGSMQSVEHNDSWLKYVENGARERLHNYNTYTHLLIYVNNHLPTCMQAYLFSLHWFEYSCYSKGPHVL